jgi:hypothetical protein
MAKRSLEDIIANDRLGLLKVDKAKAVRQNIESIYVQIYEDIRSFVKAHGREPCEKSSSIHEAQLYARLKGLRANAEVVSILRPFDTELKLMEHSENSGAVATGESYPISKPAAPSSLDQIMGSALLKDSSSIFTIINVPESTKSQSVNEYQAQRTKCQDFDKFKELFKQIQQDLDNGIRKTVKIEGIADIKAGQSFIVGGLIAYVANIGEKYEHRKGHHNARTRVIFSNGMESDLLLRSFGAALYKDKTARAITGAEEGPLFQSNQTHKQADKTGIVYVLKSNSNLPEIKSIRTILHKIGVTSGSVKSRIANAKNDPTYLLADVELVAEFTLYGLDPKAVEKVLHTFFDQARTKISIYDRFGKSVNPREWFTVPVSVIKEALDLLQNGQLANAEYDALNVRILRR